MAGAGRGNGPYKGDMEAGPRLGDADILGALALLIAKPNMAGV